MSAFQSFKCCHIFCLIVHLITVQQTCWINANSRGIRLFRSKLRCGLLELSRCKSWVERCPEVLELWFGDIKIHYSDNISERTSIWPKYLLVHVVVMQTPNYRAHVKEFMSLVKFQRQAACRPSATDLY